MLPKPIPPSQSEIDADLAANIAALGVDPESAVLRGSKGEQVFAAMEALVRELKRPIRPRELGARLSFSQSTVNFQLQELRTAGRVLLIPDPEKCDRFLYLPKVV
jgi:hypothetical protein